MTHVLAAVIAFTQQDPTDKVVRLDRVIRENSYPIRVENGHLAGNGQDLLIKEAKNAQFVAIGENHNRLEIPQIATMLFRDLQNRYDFQYVAIESAGVATGLLNNRPYRGDANKIAAYAKKYPYALTFSTDQEVQMIADISAASRGRGRPVWGLDQEFGVVPAMDYLMPRAKTEVARKAIAELRKKAEPFETMESEKHFLAEVSESEDFARLRKGFNPTPGSEEEFAIDQLAKSEEIYENYRRAVKGEATGWKSNSVREDNMKDLFMREYRRAQKNGDKLPKAVLKLGHFHLYQGMNPSLTLSTGNFIRELAKSNGLTSLNIFCAINNDAELPPDKEYDFVRPFLTRCDIKSWTLIDIRPLRNYYYAGQLPKADAEFVRMVYGFDFMLVLGGSKSATYDMIKDK